MPTPSVTEIIRVLEPISIFTLKYLWPIWLIPVGLIVFRILRYFHRRHQLSRSNIHDIDHMEGFQFEAYLVWLFQKLGFKHVANVGDTGDFGADVIIYQNNQKIVVQAKRYFHPVGVEAVQQTVAAKGFYQADHAMVVTNNTYTHAAKRLAQANHIELWDRTLLIKKILKAKSR